MEHKPEKDQENNIHSQEHDLGKSLDNGRVTLVPHPDGQGADLVDQRSSLLPSDDAAPEEEEKDRQ
jgi:hypothetical protein